MTKVKINPKGGQCTWTLSLSHLKLGLYSGLLFDAKSHVIKEDRYENQRTDDSLPDSFTLKTPAAKLIGCILRWDCIVSDPGNSGGPYNCIIAIQQDGKIISQDSVPSTVPPGKGKSDYICDEIVFE